MSAKIQQLKCLLLAASLLAVASACSSVGRVESDPKGDIMLLSPNYTPQENLGPGPIDVISTENLVRYRLDAKNGLPEYLLVLYPAKLSGSLNIKLSNQVNAAQAGIYSVYFDRLLSAHRMLLKGDLVGAKTLAEQIEADFEGGFGTAVLLGNIALLNGDKAAAARHFTLAQSLVPTNGVLESFVRKAEGQP